MRSNRHVVVVAAISALAPLAGLAAAGPAHATGVTPFTITESVDFTGGGANTFTASDPLCAAGTFADDVQTQAPSGGSFNGPDHSGGFNLVIRTVYTCADGSGSFFALKHVHITFTDTGSSNTGPIQLLGGTGAYTRLTGHGVDNGAASGDTGTGLISGFVTS
jgi:hypothetical protein